MALARDDADLVVGKPANAPVRQSLDGKSAAAMRVMGGAEVGSRVGIAAAGFLVAYGLLVGGAGNIPANATPAPGSVSADDGDDGRTESGQDGGAPSAARPGGRGHASPGAGSRGDEPDGRKPRERKYGSGRVPHQKPQTEDGGDAETPPKEPPREEPPGEEDPDDCWPWPPGPRPDPSPPGNGGGAGPPIRPPAGRPHAPPMQLPPHLLPEHTPSQPGVVDAEPGIGIAAPQLPVAPIALPIVVAPPVALPGGAAPRGLPTEPVPASPRGPATEPPAGRQAPPAETASNVAAPPPSYRAGYTEYLRNAGISQVALVAAPGLAGMVLLTGVGGLVGYRQAKAGHAVRAGGAARFVD
ncbi:hypothetical protein BST47_21825 [Mycolicibacterium tusciae]|uniref:Uncharacterized protein n=1 Tax=Mycolicibacterium tusciae TaxID=75922 RepID=A0A1X0JK62_9MYCO|nr:hypothetical protein BST47_21825 [Mycolicibacterium tusciae]